MNSNALVALVLATVLGIPAGAYAYSNVVAVRDSDVKITDSTISITNSNVTITNSTIVIGEGNTIIYPSPTPKTDETNNTENSPHPRTPPEITNVSPITASQTQTIMITGSGFGDIQPQLLNLSDGSVDTIWGGFTPSIVFYDKSNLLSAGAAGDWSGFTNGPPDLIGIFLVSWTDTKIVLGGFGTGLGSRFSWTQVSKGDILQIQIQTEGGFVAFDTVVA